MSADLYLYAGPTDPAWRARWSKLVGVQWTADRDGPRDERGYLTDFGGGGLTTAEHADLMRTTLWGTPRLWIGQVSWLGADLTGGDEHVPAPISRIVDVVGAGRTLTRGVAGEVLAAMNLPNRSAYQRRRIEYIDDPQEYRIFLDVNGSRVRGLGYGQVLLKAPDRSGTVGLARRQHVRAWLAEHSGAFLVHASE